MTSYVWRLLILSNASSANFISNVSGSIQWPLNNSYGGQSIYLLLCILYESHGVFWLLTLSCSGTLCRCAASESPCTLVFSHHWFLLSAYGSLHPPLIRRVVCCQLQSQKSAHGGSCCNELCLFLMRPKVLLIVALHLSPSSAVIIFSVLLAAVLSMAMGCCLWK